jgi:hypothetical protein
MKIASRDIEILTLVNRHGWLSADVMLLAGLYSHKNAALRRLRQLENEDYLESDRPFLNRPKAFWTTYKGQSLSRSHIEPSSSPNLNEWTHDITVTRLSFHLIEEGNKWITERELYRELEDFDHLPDGSIQKTSGRIAVEYEHSRKKKGRLKSILREYVKSSAFSKVLYFGADQKLVDHVKKCGGDKFGKVEVFKQEPIPPAGGS